MIATMLIAGIFLTGLSVGYNLALWRVSHEQREAIDALRSARAVLDRRDNDEGAGP